MKGGAFLTDDVRDLLADCAAPDPGNWSIELDHHFGGFARWTDELLAFMAGCTAEHGIPLDPVYTGKMVYAIVDLARQGRFRPGSTVVALHTGRPGR